MALRSGGVAGTFVTSPFGWLRTRRPSLKVSIIEKSRSMTVSAARNKSPAPLLREFLMADDGH